MPHERACGWAALHINFHRVPKHSFVPARRWPIHTQKKKQKVEWQGWSLSKINNFWLMKNQYANMKNFLDKLADQRPMYRKEYASMIKDKNKICNAKLKSMRKLGSIFPAPFTTIVWRRMYDRKCARRITIRNIINMEKVSWVWHNLEYTIQIFRPVGRCTNMESSLSPDTPRPPATRAAYQPT